MAYLIDLNAYSDKRGRLTVVEKVLPFNVNRIYYIQDVTDGQARGRHRHFETIEGVISVCGSLTAHIISETVDEEYELNDSSKCLIIEPGDWHEFYNFDKGAVLMGISSTAYDKADYATDPLPRKEGLSHA